MRPHLSGLVDKSFGWVDINIEYENISISADIRREGCDIVYLIIRIRDTKNILF